MNIKKKYLEIVSLSGKTTFCKDTIEPKDKQYCIVFTECHTHSPPKATPPPKKKDRKKDQTAVGKPFQSKSYLLGGRGVASIE